MNKTFNTIIKAFKRASLSTEEKRRVWASVDAYVKEHPQGNRGEYSTSTFISNRFHMLSPYFMHSHRIAVFAVAFVFILGGSTSLAAEHALPNDALYTIKVNVNEEVRSWFSFGAESKAYFETKRAGERLEEAKTLAIMGELNVDAKEKIKKNFERHAQKVQDQVATIEASNNLKVAINVAENFENSLREHSRSLTKIEEVRRADGQPDRPARLAKETGISSGSADNVAVSVMDAATLSISVDDQDSNSSDTETQKKRDEIGEIVDSIQKNITRAEMTRTSVEAKITTTADNATRKSVAEDTRKDAWNRIERIQAVLGATTTVFADIEHAERASTTLSYVLDRMALGDSHFEAGEYGEAFLLFKDAIQSVLYIEELLRNFSTAMNYVDANASLFTEKTIASSTKKDLLSRDKANRLEASIIQSKE